MWQVARTCIVPKNTLGAGRASARPCVGAWQVRVVFVSTKIASAIPCVFLQLRQYRCKHSIARPWLHAPRRCVSRGGTITPCGLANRCRASRPHRPPRLELGDAARPGSSGTEKKREHCGHSCTGWVVPTWQSTAAQPFTAACLGC